MITSYNIRTYPFLSIAHFGSGVKTMVLSWFCEMRNTFPVWSCTEIDIYYCPRFMNWEIYGKKIMYDEFGSKIFKMMTFKSTVNKRIETWECYLNLFLVMSKSHNIQHNEWFVRQFIKSQRIIEKRKKLV